MRTRRGKVVRILVSLPEELLASLEKEGIPLSVYVKNRVSLLINSLNVMISAASEDNDERALKKRPVGVYLHEKEYQALLFHLKWINSFIRRKLRKRPLTINQLLYRALYIKEGDDR